MKTSAMQASVLSLVLAAAASSAGAEVIPGTTLSIDFQGGLVQPSGRNIQVFRIPVTDTASGATTYYDATFEFGVLPDGSLGFVRLASAAVATSPLRGADSYSAGTYRDQAGNTYLVAGPAILSGGRSSYSITSTTAGKTFNASWITGTSANHPQMGNFGNFRPTEGSAGAFGIMGATNFSIDSTFVWCAGLPIGATQASATILVLSRYFGNGCGGNYGSGALNSITLTRL